jgi:hypothetical protein
MQSLPALTDDVVRRLLTDNGLRFTVHRPFHGVVVVIGRLFALVD